MNEFFEKENSKQILKTGGIIFKDACSILPLLFCSSVMVGLCEGGSLLHGMSTFPPPRPVPGEPLKEENPPEVERCNRGDPMCCGPAVEAEEPSGGFQA